MPESSSRPTLDAYLEAIVASWKRGLFPFTAAIGREVELDPEAIHVDPWLEVAPDGTPAPVGTSTDCEHHELSTVDRYESRRDRTLTWVEKHGALGLVILGDPGAGKSTLMRWLARRALSDGRRTPILLSAVSYAEHLATEGALSLPEIAAAFWASRGAPGLAPLFTAAIAQGDALILIDGFDEAGDRRTRQSIAARIMEDMTRWRGTSNRWVLASRPHGYSDAPLPDPALTRATICPWDSQQIEAAVRGWCRALAQWQAVNVGAAPEEAALLARTIRLRDQLLDHGPLQQLAQNPLSLAMLVLLERMRDRLPEHRVRLYEAYADELIQRRRAPPTADELDPSEFLIELALWIHRKHPMGGVRATDMADQCLRIALRYEGYLRPEDASADILALATRRARCFYAPEMTEAAGGILVESSPGYLSFSHRALQDFFVGRGLARMASNHRWELLRPRLHAARWREPLLLCAGWLAVVERRREEIDLLCGQVLQANSNEESLLARDLRLVVEIATNSAGLVRHQRLAEFHQRIEHFFATVRSFAVFQMLLEITARLARLGLSEAQRALEEWIENSPQDFQRVALIALRGKLDGAAGQHLRDMAIEKLSSDDPGQCHIAWHDLLPLWSQSDVVRESLLAATEHDRIPRCDAIAKELVRRALESPPEVAERLREHQWLWTYMPRVLCEEMPGSEELRSYVVEEIRSASDLGVALAARLAWTLDDPLLRPEIEPLLAHPNTGIRLGMLTVLASPRHGERTSRYLQAALDDADETVRSYAAQVAEDLPFHLAGGLQRAEASLQGGPDERRRVARNLRPEWWSSVNLRSRLLALFSTADPELATIAFNQGFAHLFTGQSEMIEVTVQALASEHTALREAALAAMTPHLHAVPAFADAVFSLLQHSTWPDLPRIIELLQRVVDNRGDVRERMCELLRDSDSPLDVRRAAVACLARVSHHDMRVWNAVKSIVEQGLADIERPLFSDAHGVLLRLGEFLPAEGLRRGIVLLDGQPAGLLEETPSGTRFTYDESWLANPDAMPISLTMPLRALPYESDGLHPFFDNMLPEGWLLERVSGAEKIDKRDRLGILLATGSDTIGAVSVIPDATPEEDG